MSIRNAGQAIREARIKAGLSQEKLAEGICSSRSLSRIENGTAGVSPSTFQALMAHAGAACEIYPIFANRTDFDCFYALKHVRFYLDSWQLDLAYEELNKLEQMNWADSKFYYQEWLLLHCRLQYRSGNENHLEICNTLLETLHISRPDIDLTDFRTLLLSINEVELLIALAQEYYYLQELDTCLSICTQLSTYLENAQISYLEKDRLEAEYSIVYTKYLLATGDYENALKLADEKRHQMVLNSDDGPLLELTFLTGLGYYFTNEHDKALTHFKTVFYSAHAIESCFSTICHNYVLKNLDLDILDELNPLPDIPLKSYDTKKAIDTSTLGDGTYDIFSPEVFTIGSLIREFRKEQKLSQLTLCQGLCSKSKLSKIENGTLQPDIFLTEALLQRLGISERIFTFWGDAREASIYELKFKLIHRQHLPKNELLDYLEEFKHLITEKDVLPRQFYLLETALLKDSTSERLSYLFDALHCTLPKFDINLILNYRLTWAELTILNNIAFDYRDSDIAYKSIIYFDKLFEYRMYTLCDIIFQCHIFTVTLYLFSRSLYSQKHYAEVINLFSLKMYKLLKCQLEFLGSYFFFYAQSLGECSKFDNIRQFAIYSYYIDYLLEFAPNAVALKTYIKEDFNIDIN